MESNSSKAQLQFFVTGLQRFMLALQTLVFSLQRLVRLDQGVMPGLHAGESASRLECGFWYWCGGSLSRQGRRSWFQRVHRTDIT